MNVPEAVSNDTIEINNLINDFHKFIFHKCSTQLSIPNELILWCNLSNTPVSECNNYYCQNCTNGIFNFRCRKHNEILMYRSKNKQSYIHTTNTTMCSNGRYANKCCYISNELNPVFSSCNIMFEYGSISGNKFTESLCCSHDKLPGHIASRECLPYEEFAKTFIDVFKHLTDKQSKVVLVKLLMYDGPKYEFSDTNLHALEYNEIVWNLLVHHIKSHVGNHLEMNLCTLLNGHSILKSVTKLSRNQIYRLIHIGDLSMCDKLYLYAQDNCKNVSIDSSKKFVKENIYNIEYFTKGLVFELKKNDTTHPYNHVPDQNNYKYTKLIYNKATLKCVRRIRKTAFGGLEDTIKKIFIPMAYEKYGLFWLPEELPKFQYEY